MEASHVLQCTSCTCQQRPGGVKQRDALRDSDRGEGRRWRGKTGAHTGQAPAGRTRRRRPKAKQFSLQARHPCFGSSSSLPCCACTRVLFVAAVPCWANVAVLGCVVGDRGRLLLFGLRLAASGWVQRMACGGCRGCLLDATWTGEALRVARHSSSAAATGKHAATVWPAPGRLLTDGDGDI